MGYCTYFELTIKKTDNITPATVDEANTIMDWLKENNVYVYNMFASYGISDYMQSDDCYKWYEYEEDMIALSKQFPDFIFTLFGDGEDGDDFWYADFMDGKHKFRPVRFVYPDFDETPWEI